jgi:hypothetical protein
MIRSAAIRAMRAARTTYSLRRFEVVASGGKARRPLCFVYGNCQADPIRALLASVPEFADSYEAVRIPAVHLITAAQLAKLQTILPAASLIIAQPIKDAYRGLPLGMNEVLALAPRNCSVIRFPALYYDALYPFQGYVRTGSTRTAQAPLTTYHDLRMLCAAARGLTDDAAVRWISDYRPPETALRAAAEEAAAKIREREGTTDISAVEALIAAPRAHARSFFTVNHPARFVLQHIADRIRDILGLQPVSDVHGGGEPLGVFHTPLEQTVIDALGLPSDPAPDWLIKGKRVATTDVVRLHLNWYRQYPDVVDAGLRDHAARIAAFGLLT